MADEGDAVSYETLVVQRGFPLISLAALDSFPLEAFSYSTMARISF